MNDPTFLSTNYSPPKKNLWQGREDSLPEERFFQIVQLIDLQQQELPAVKNKTFALIGFCCDTGVVRNLGRSGARLGADALRSALAKLSLPAERKFSFLDLGDINCLEDDLESAQLALGILVNKALVQGMIPIVLGGGHEIAFGHYLGINQYANTSPVGIINFDAHFDLRPMTNAKGNSGTPFTQIKALCDERGFPFNYMCVGIQPNANTKSLRQRAAELKVRYLTAEEIHANNEQHIKEQLNNFINPCNYIYLSLCLDVFAESIAPGVSAPQALGLWAQQVIKWMRYVVQSNKVLSFDIAELSPPHDLNNMTARLGGNLLAEFICSMIDF